MSIQRDFFQRRHPEQFSDSIIVKKAELNKDFMDYYLEKISSRSQEKEFEQFCKKIVEAEICPNLITQTGPTGGGDSKVDSETYPVAETLSETWFYGDGNKAGNERWAFAISAKQDWSGKVKSDVAKIVKVNKDENRGYTKIFFVSNQYISDKKRADKENELRGTSNIDIRIFDKNWLLDKIFAKDTNKKITVECFHLSEKLLDEKKVGEYDYSRENNLKNIEEKLANPTELKVAEIVAFAKKSVELGRELEYNEHDILGLIDRYKRLVNEYGNKNDNVECLYVCAWTIYWWYTDANRFYGLYVELEKKAFPNGGIYAFEKIITLWINLNALRIDGFEVDIDIHTKKIMETYKRLTADSTKPNTILQAKNAYQLMRIFLGDDINNIVKQYIDIINKSSGSLELDLYKISKIIQEIPLFEEAEQYNELFELVVERMGKENKDGEVGRMLAQRGHALKDTKPYEAITYFSRTLRRFYNESNKNHLITSVLEIGEMFEKIGLFWAARNFYLYDFCICLNKYMKQGEITPVLMLSANCLKYIELRLGRVMYSSEFYCLEQVGRQLYPEKFEKKEENYDYILAMQIFRTPFEKLANIGGLSGYFEERGLVFSNVAVEYELGHYDDEMLNAFNGDMDVFNDFIVKWKGQPVLKELKSEPWYGFEDKIYMKSRVVGCLFTIETVNNAFAIEFASSVLATIECFLGTGINNNLISMVGKIEISVLLGKGDKFKAEVIHNDVLPTKMSIEITKYNKEEYLQAQSNMHDKLTEILGYVISIMFPYSKEFDKIKEMTEKEESIVRTDIFANSTFIGIETFGDKAFSFNDLTEKYEVILLERNTKSELTDFRSSENDYVPQNDFEIKYTQPPEKDEFKNTSNENIITSSVINIPLWNNCGWKGVMFCMANGKLPILAPVFDKEDGKEIFAEWIKEVGNEDKENKIGIRIIKGIDRKHPTWYRVIIGSNDIPIINNDIKRTMFMLPTRLHTMEAVSEENVMSFEKILKITKDYYICPAIMKENGAPPELDWTKLIIKHNDSIKICNAWEVGNNDILFEAGIMPEDDPFLPKGNEKANIVSIIMRKKLNQRKMYD